MIERRVGAVTVKLIEFEITPLCVEVMVLEPTPTPVASPLLLRVATAVLDDCQAAVLVRFCVLPSLNVPVAVN